MATWWSDWEMAHGDGTWNPLALHVDWPQGDKGIFGNLSTHRILYFFYLDAGIILQDKLTQR